MTEHSPDGSDTARGRPHGRYTLFLIALPLALAIWGVVDRVTARASVAIETAAAAMPVVITLKAAPPEAAEELVLPGSVQAFAEAPIYARTSGYLERWYTDIGSRVKKGQLLAKIDTPEVDQQLDQALADLATVKANAELARTTNERWRGLLATHSVSQQDADAKAGDAAAKQAAEDSASANVARLRDMESFKSVLAPFDGVVTQRNTDIGALINAGQSAGSALFQVADTRRLRIYVLVPEPYAAAMTSGVDAELRFAEHPGKSYPAKIVRSAEALDPALRTLQVELQVDNSAGALLPGAYAEVHFGVPASSQSLRVPADTLLFRSAGLQVATVGADHRVRLKNIVAGRDFGSSIEVLSGLTADDDVVINPPDSLIDGTAVQISAARPVSADSPARRQEKIS